MNNNIDNLIDDWERRINQLSDYILELETKVYQYELLLNEKENQIKKLLDENSQLKSQIQAQQKQTLSPTYYSQRAPSILASDQPVLSSLSSEDLSAINKRKCPKCGAMGFAIKEVDDHNKVLSYIPRKIYAKKKVCTKCRYEF
jgi:chromosome segregation ATPase